MQTTPARLPTMNRGESPLASPGSSKDGGEITRVNPKSGQSKILSHFKQLTTQKAGKPGSGRRVEIVESHEDKYSPGKPVAKGRVKVTDDSNPSSGGKHFLVRLYEAGKKALQKSEDQYLDEKFINLGAGEETETVSKRPKRKKESAKLMDEYPIRGKIEIQGDESVASGGFCEVYQGRFRRDGQKLYEMVALKRLNVADTPEKDRKMFRRETNAWNKLKHPNVLPFYGTVVLKKDIFMVSPWAENGDLHKYLGNNPNLDRQPLLMQIADALRYLHDDCKLIHGDVKVQNVLVSAKGDALLADFGLVTRIEKLPGATATGKSVAHAMTIIYSAPELLAASMDEGSDAGKVAKSAKSWASDVYAFGLLMISVYSMRKPWYGLTPQQIAGQILLGNKPRRPAKDSEAFSRGLTEFLLQLAEKCLEANPEDRPSMAALIKSLKEGPRPVDAKSPTDTVNHVDNSVSSGTAEQEQNNAKQLVLTKPKTDDHLQVKKRVQSEMKALTKIQHPHILPLIGRADMESYLFIVTPWMENGNIMTYVNRNPTVDRLNLLYQASDALFFLHSGEAANNRKIVHGSLQPDSLLINDRGSVALTDVGLSNLHEDLQLNDPMNGQIDDTSVRFHPPEAFNPEHTPSLTDDVWSFAMVMFQVLTNEIPYADAANPLAVINRIIRGDLPTRPRVGVDDATWSLLSECWSYSPAKRPSMDDVRRRLAAALQLKIEDAPSAEGVRSQFANILLPEILDVD